MHGAVCRNNITFVYENDRPRGLLANKRATVIITSGGTMADTDVDYASNYIRHIMEFIGIMDVAVIDVTGLAKNRRKVIADARREIAIVSERSANSQRNLSVAE